jgi:3-oxoacyl-(acyl-carrier-protein) synthase
MFGTFIKMVETGQKGVHYWTAGVSVGCGMAGIVQMVESGLQVLRGDLRRVTPYHVPAVLNNMPAGKLQSV